VTETRLDDDLVVFLFFISSSDWNKIGWRPCCFLLFISNNKVVIQSCFSHY
jgi:hypothetical protein